MVIDTFYFKYVTIFPKEFLEKYKNNPNVPQNMPSDIKNNFFPEESLYSQVVMFQIKTKVK